MLLKTIKHVSLLQAALFWLGLTAGGQSHGVAEQPPHPVHANEQVEEISRSPSAVDSSKNSLTTQTDPDDKTKIEDNATDAPLEIKPGVDGQQHVSPPLTEHPLYEDSVLGLLSCSPRRLVNDPLLKSWRENGPYGLEFGRLCHQYAIPPEQIERLVWFIDGAVVHDWSREWSLGVYARVGSLNELRDVQRRMTRISMALREERFSRPNPERLREMPQVGTEFLSWRVHLLPHMNAKALYEEFHLNERWDSDHNRRLIERMPSEYRSLGVTEPGKTSIHRFVAQAPKTAANSNEEFLANVHKESMMHVVMAGTETADIWTKPGHLTFIESDPWSNLGQLKPHGLPFTTRDGTFRVLSETCPPNLFATFTYPTARSQYPLASTYLRHRSLAMPLAVLQLTSPIDLSQLVAAAVPFANAQFFAGGTIHANGTNAIGMIDKYLFTGSEMGVRRLMLTANSLGKDRFQKAVEWGHENDLTADWRLDQFWMSPENPRLPGWRNARFCVNFSGQFSHPEITIRATRPVNSAAPDVVLWKPFTQALLGRLLIEAPADFKEPILNWGAMIADSGSMSPDGASIVLKSHPKGTEPIDPATLSFGLSRWQTTRHLREHFQRLARIGLAFHNYHDTFSHFPAVDRFAPNYYPPGPMRDAESLKRLSWRVNLLPFLGDDAIRLYNRFHRDEPWDSAHNLTLVSQMPDWYRSPGVAMPGMTALHVFTGPNSPFADGKFPKVADFRDGLSETILAVHAAPERAEIWTKPVGLSADFGTALETVGYPELRGLTFIDASGTARYVDLSELQDDELLSMIRHNDGKPFPAGKVLKSEARPWFPPRYDDNW